MDTQIHKNRTRKVQKQLQNRDIDALILAPGDDQQYLSGSTEKQATPRHTFFIVTPEEAVFFLSSNNENNIRPSTWVSDLVVWDDDTDPLQELEPLVKELGISDESTVLVNEQMWATFLNDLHRLIDAEVGMATELMMEFRMTKDESEVSQLEHACNIADGVSEEIRKEELVGMTEREVSAEIQYRMKNRGADDESFTTVVASGPNSAKPSYSAGSRTIEEGDPVVLDFGAEVGGYKSDQTRTMIAGGAPPKGFEEAFAVAKNAQREALDAIKPGMIAHEIDDTARSVIEKEGFGDHFLHVTGHGIGLGIHEPPFLMSGDYLGGGNEHELEQGMVLTVEPGLYFDDWGLRIEEDILVTKDGCRKLTDSPLSWDIS